MDWKRAYRLLGCAGLLSALPLVANAAIITHQLNTDAASAFIEGSSTGSTSFGFCDTLPGATNTCSGSAATRQNNGATFHYDGTATAAYGVLKAGGSSSITGAPGTPDSTYTAETSGSSSFEDTWTITGGTGTGILNLKFALDGSYSQTPGTGLGFSFILTNHNDHADSDNASDDVVFPSASGTIAQEVTLSTPFTFGTPLDFDVYLRAASTLNDLGDDVSSSLDLTDTAMMNAIQVKDPFGNILPFTLSTASGAALFNTLAAPSGPTSVPEPSSIALFGAGLLGLFWLSARSPLRRRRSAAA